MDTIESLRHAALDAAAAAIALDQLWMSLLRLGPPFEERAQDVMDIRRLLTRQCDRIDSLYQRERTREEPMGQ